MAFTSLAYLMDIAWLKEAYNPTKNEVARLVKSAVKHKLALSFNLLMYEDGSVSPASLEMMRHVREVAREK